MKRHSTYLAVVLVAALGIAACGKDNNGNDNTGVTATRTPTPGAPTRTPTPIVSNSTSPATATPTTGTSPSTSTSTSPGTPSPTPTGSGEPVCNGMLSLQITSAAGSVLDTGWTGISHGQTSLEQAQTTVDVDCTAAGGGPNHCTVHGEALAGTKFGSPLPLAAGGVGVCVINTFREGITGTYDCEAGCGESNVHLTSRVIQAQDIAHPCPNCIGDPTPNDGQKGGTCNTGASAGQPCDVGGINPDFGATSNDCLPSAGSIGDLAIDITPLTTGTVSVTGTTACQDAKDFGSVCFVASQDRPNSCLPTGTDCPASGACDDPVTTFCSGQTFRTCQTPGDTSDCEDFTPGAGVCTAGPRFCFGNTITRTGQCGTQSGTLVGIFNIPATNTPAINTVSGLPGPGALSLPVTSVRTPK